MLMVEKASYVDTHRKYQSVVGRLELMQITISERSHHLTYFWEGLGREEIT